MGPALYARPIATCNSAIGDQHRPAQQRAEATAMIAPESQPAEHSPAGGADDQGFGKAGERIAK